MTDQPMSHSEQAAALREQWNNGNTKAGDEGIALASELAEKLSERTMMFEVAEEKLNETIDKLKDEWQAHASTKWELEQARKELGLHLSEASSLAALNLKLEKELDETKADVAMLLRDDLAITSCADCGFEFIPGKASAAAHDCPEPGSLRALTEKRPETAERWVYVRALAKRLRDNEAASVELVETKRELEREREGRERAELVVRRAMAECDHPGTCCPVCRSFTWNVDDKAPQFPHEEDCPLVAGGYINREGAPVAAEDPAPEQPDGKGGEPLCRWCGKTLAEHRDAPDPRFTPRMPCTGLKAFFMAEGTGRKAKAAGKGESET